MPFFIILAIAIIAYFIYTLYLKENRKKDELKRTIQTGNFEKIIEQVKKSARGDQDKSVSFALARSYFYTNEPEAFFAQKKNFLALAAREKNAPTAQAALQLELMEMVLLYVGEQTEKANRLREELTSRHEQLHYLTAESDVGELYLMGEMMHAFYAGQYEKVKEIYDTLSKAIFEVNKKTMIVHYLCRVYEAQGREEEIAPLIKQISVENNYYWDLIDQWYE